MLEVRKSDERGQGNHGWLNSFHSFSFAGYHDPAHMGFGPLRVINEDRVAPGQGFGTHGHRNMEIISYVLSGALAHKDSTGGGSVLHYGDVQRMSAGSGVMHSEFNGSREEEVHFLQIWIMPDVADIAPGYEEKHFTVADKTQKLRLIASADGRDNSLLIHQDASVYASLLDGEDAVTHLLAPKRLGYVHVARGEIDVNGVHLQAGDALKLTAEAEVVLSRAKQAEILLFDLPH